MSLSLTIKSNDNITLYIGKYMTSSPKYIINRDGLGPSPVHVLLVAFFFFRFVHE